jgi:glycosyltransferase involved in cell wall biosynthesis
MAGADGPMARPCVSVIIPARQAASTIGRTLSALSAQQLDQAFEVIVVDDGSTDETAAIAERHMPLVSVIHNGRSRGAGAARNRGVAAARASVIAFTDADCFPTPDWLAHGLESLAEADLVQGRVTPDPSVTRTPFDRSLSVDRDAGFYQTANLFVRRDVLDLVGGFREWALERSGQRRDRLNRRRDRVARPVGEDTLMAWSARRRGVRTAFASDAVVHHVVVPGNIRAAVADRWHWTRLMPGLVRLVPELRDAVFFRRWFFADWTAQFDLAVAGVAAAAITRRRVFLLSAVPYVRRVRLQAGEFHDDSDSGLTAIRKAAMFALGAPVVDAATLAGLVVGTIEWRCPVL